jgi:hypothetical protein
MAVTLQASFEELGAVWGLLSQFGRERVNPSDSYMLSGYVSVLDNEIVEAAGEMFLAHNPSWPDPTFEGVQIPWPWLGWPLFAAIPGDFYNAQTAAGDPDYEYGGKYVRTGMEAKYDITTNAMVPGFSAPGGWGGVGLGSQPWDIDVITQRCWVILLVAPFMLRPSDGPYPGGSEVPPWWHTEPWTEPLGYGMNISFRVQWRLGPGSDQVGLGTPASPDVGGTSTVGAGTGSGRTFSKTELVALYTKHSFPDPNLTAAIALAESAGDPSAVNTNTDGSTDIGLLQINSIHGYDQVMLADPDYNADAGYDVSSGGTDYTPWVTYNNGAYLDFL